MKKQKLSIEPLSLFQLIFKQSPANGAEYRDPPGPYQQWNWPQGTYLQRALERKHRTGSSVDSNN